MDAIRVIGGSPLNGTVRIHGAKNAALPLLAATAAIRGSFVLQNCPEILDIEITRKILDVLNIQTRRAGDALLVDSTRMQYAAIPRVLACRLRASVLFLGALTAAWEKAEVPYPGGDCFGSRPIDYHVQALHALGVSVQAEEDAVFAEGRPQSATVELPFPSVGATENALLAALGADGPVRIIGAAREPEIGCLCAFLSACGAKVRGIGTSCLTVTTGELHGAAFPILPDRIEAATYLCAAAATGGHLTLTGARAAHIRPVLDALQSAGCEIAEARGALTIEAGPLHAIPPVVTAPYPGFPTDIQPLLTAALLRADGVTVVEERVFRGRYRHIPALRAMGADLETAGQILRIRGVGHLHGTEAEATDLRGGAAMLIAALSAEGRSRIGAAQILERGYEALIPNLQAIGADVSEA